jgi:hypothetical protein
VHSLVLRIWVIPNHISLFQTLSPDQYHSLLLLWNIIVLVVQPLCLHCQECLYSTTLLKNHIRAVSLMLCVPTVSVVLIYCRWAVDQYHIQCNSVCFTLSMLCSAARYDVIYLLTAIGLSPGGSNTHLHTNNTQNDTKQTIHRTAQQLEECGLCPVLASYTLAFALQPRKKHGKTSVRVGTSKNTWTTISIHRQR